MAILAVKNPMLITSKETRLSTKEIIALRTGWRICDAIKDEQRATCFVSFLNSQLEGKGLPKVSGTDKIPELMAAMLPIGKLMGGYDSFRKHIPATDTIVAHVAMGKTFADANEGNGRYHVYKDTETGEIWKFKLPEVCISCYGGESFGKEVPLADIRPNREYTFLLATSLDKVVSFSVEGKENVLDFAPSAWLVSSCTDMGGGQYTNMKFGFHDGGQLAHWINYPSSTEPGIRLADKFGMSDTRDRWMGLLKINLDTDRAEYDLRDRILISAAHQASWPTHVIIDADEAQRLVAEKQPAKSAQRGQPSLGSVTTIPVEIPKSEPAAPFQAEDAPTQNGSVAEIVATIDKHIASAQAAIAGAQKTLAQLIELKNKIIGEQGN